MGGMVVWGLIVVAEMVWLGGFLSYVEVDLGGVHVRLVDEGFHVFDEAGLESGDVGDAEDAD
jgi:hypothetical protein